MKTVKVMKSFPGRNLKYIYSLSRWARFLNMDVEHLIDRVKEGKLHKISKGLYIQCKNPQLN